MSTSTRECELTIGTTRWRMTLGESEGRQTWDLSRATADGSWDEVAAGMGGPETMRAWASADFIMEAVPGVSAALERFAEVMVVQ